MQPTGRSGASPRSATARLERAVERSLVRGRARSPQLLRKSLGTHARRSRTHGSSHANFVFRPGTSIPSLHGRGARAVAKSCGRVGRGAPEVPATLQLVQSLTGRQRHGCWQIEALAMGGHDCVPASGGPIGRGPVAVGEIPSSAECWITPSSEMGSRILSFLMGV
jgi:hypothetical protein